MRSTSWYKPSRGRAKFTRSAIAQVYQGKAQNAKYPRHNRRTPQTEPQTKGAH